MDFPSFYNPETVGDLYTPDVSAATNAGLATAIAPAADDTTRTLLLLVDVQVDFVHPDGSLAVPGAVDDLQRTVEWIYRNLGQITDITASLDSHIPYQIFYPTWWRNPNGAHPEPFSVVTAADVASGTWQPIMEADWSRGYVTALETQAKKQLMIWPYHTMIGTQGQALMPSLYEAISYHAAARQAQPEMLRKGTIAKSEFYSMLEPEVKISDDPKGDINTDLLERIAGYDRVYMTGQAKSHCVQETVTSMMNYFEDRPEVIEKIHLLTDGTSAIAHPEIDFDALADETLAGYAEKGLKLVTTAEDLA